MTSARSVRIFSKACTSKKDHDNSNADASILGIEMDGARRKQPETARGYSSEARCNYRGEPQYFMPHFPPRPARPPCLTWKPDFQPLMARRGRAREGDCDCDYVLGTVRIPRLLAF